MLFTVLLQSDLGESRLYGHSSRAHRKCGGRSSLVPGTSLERTAVARVVKELSHQASKLFSGLTPLQHFAGEGILC